MMEAGGKDGARGNGAYERDPMVPFCRTVEEGCKCKIQWPKRALHEVRVAERQSARRRKGKTVTPIYVMCEIPSNILNADRFLDIFDGMSIGSNDLTQLTMALTATPHCHAYRERKECGRGAPDRGDYRKVPRAQEIHRHLRPGPSDYPDFAAFLVTKGIESMSLNPTRWSARPLRSRSRRSS